MEGEAQQVHSGPVGGSYNALINRSASMECDVISNQIHLRPSKLYSDVNSNISGEKGWYQRTVKTPEMLQKRLEGQKRAECRESACSAAMRAIAFGLLVRGTHGQPKRTSKNERPEKVRRTCKALLNRSLVNPSLRRVIGQSDGMRIETAYEIAIRYHCDLRTATELHCDTTFLALTPLLLAKGIL